MEQLVAVYSRRDLSFVRSLRSQLRPLGVSLWLDVEELAPGKTWRALFTQAFESSAAALVIHSWEWIYDSRFVPADLPFVIDVARSLRSCPPILALRVDNAPIALPLRALRWAGAYDKAGVPAIAIAVEAACRDRSGAGPSLDALDSVVQGHDESVRRLRVHLRQHWSRTIDMMEQQDYVGAIDLWRPFSGIPGFRTDHRQWAGDVETRCAIHGIKMQLFRAYAQLGQSEFKKYVPSAYAALRELVTFAPVRPVTDDPLSQLDTEAATTQNLNYADTLDIALSWAAGWSPSVLTMFDISERESTEVFAAAARRLAELRELVGDGE